MKDQFTQTSIVQKEIAPTGKTMVLFDFDGTITKRDTLLSFIIFYKGLFRFLAGLVLLSPMFARYFLRQIPNWKAKEIFLSHYLRGESLATFNDKCQKFTETILPSLIRKGALTEIEKYKKAGAIVVVVSASAENWVKPWCEKYGLICLATQLEIEENLITGKICGKNCYGEEKVNRIQKGYQLSDFDQIIAYGDSRGDREMFALSHRHFYKPFRN